MLKSPKSTQLCQSNEQIHKYFTALQTIIQIESNKNAIFPIKTQTFKNSIHPNGSKKCQSLCCSEIKIPYFPSLKEQTKNKRIHQRNRKIKTKQNQFPLSTAQKFQFHIISITTTNKKTYIFATTKVKTNNYKSNSTKFQSLQLKKVFFLPQLKKNKLIISRIPYNFNHDN